MTDIPRADRLAEAVREFETLCFAVSHDFQGPLDSIESAAVAISVRAVDAIAVQSAMAILANIASMKAMTAKLREFYGLASQPIALEAIDMKALVVQAWAAIERREHIAFALGKLPAARGHRGMLRVAWELLLLNAVRRVAPQEKARIEVTGAVSGDSAVYSVSDNSTSFDLDYAGKLQHVFERIQKRSDASAAVELAIVQRIVTRHNGNVWVDAHRNKGVLFQFSLPTGEPRAGPQ